MRNVWKKGWDSWIYSTSSLFAYVRKTNHSSAASGFISGAWPRGKVVLYEHADDKSKRHIQGFFLA